METTTSTGRALAWRMACRTAPGAGHRTLYRIPAGAELRHGVAIWIAVGDAFIRCTEPGCNRAMRAVAVTDSHRGLGPRARCGSRCVSAIGPACDCECRGDNHGTNGD